MKKSIQKLPLVSWLIVIAVTVCVYAILADDLFEVSVKWLSLVFVLLAEISLCAKHIFAKQSMILNTNGMIGFCYLLLTIVLSFIYINTRDADTTWFAVIHILLIAALIIIDLTIINFDKKFSQNEQTMMDSMKKSRSLFLLVDTIIAENPDTEFKKELAELSESLRYADHTTLSGDEEDILVKLEDIRERIKNADKTEDISASIEVVKTLVKTRSLYIKENQRGKI